jgi:hypothetical protein
MEKSEVVELEKSVNKAKFKLSQIAGALHDLIEDRLMADFNELPDLSAATYSAACEWFKLKSELEAVKSMKN